MVARIACLAVSMGILVGCYNLPQPECGFACGPAGECPSSYACNTSVNRCELTGTTPSCTPALVDAGIVPDTDDFTPPSVQSMVPGPDSVGVSLDSIILAGFSEPVLGVNGNTMTVDDGSSFLAGAVSYDPNTMSAVFQPLGLLLPDTAYTVIVHNEITDAAGNHLPLSVVWRFRTAPDTLPPFVTLRSPAINTTGVGVGAGIFVDFNEVVTGVSNTSFVVAVGLTPVSGTVSYESETSRAIFTPTTQLAPNTTYDLSLSSAIRDLSFNALSATSWTFMTGPDLQAPIVVTRAPAVGSSGVLVTSAVTATFDETVVNVSDTSFILTVSGGAPVAATVSYTTATRTAQLTPDLQLAPNTQYAVSLSQAILDGSGNSLSPVSWTFTTGGS